MSWRQGEVKKMIYKDTAIENMYSLTESMTDEGVKLILSNCSHRNFKGYSEFKKALTEQLALQAFNCWGEIDSEDLQTCQEQKKHLNL